MKATTSQVPEVISVYRQSNIDAAGNAVANLQRWSIEVTQAIMRRDGEFDHYDAARRLMEFAFSYGQFAHAIATTHRMDKELTSKDVDNTADGVATPTTNNVTRLQAPKKVAGRK